MEESYRTYLWRKFNITPEFEFMGVNVLNDYISLRKDLIRMGDIRYIDYYPITYEEYTISKTSFIPRLFGTVPKKLQ